MTDLEELLRQTALEWTDDLERNRELIVIAAAILLGGNCLTISKMSEDTQEESLRNAVSYAARLIKLTKDKS